MANNLANPGAISSSGGPTQSGAEPDLAQIGKNTDENGRPVIQVPEGFKDIEEFMEMVRYEFQQDVDYDQDNRFAALDDLNFVGMDQWDARVRASRIQQGRPVASRNVLPQFIGQVVAERRANRVAIRLLPKEDGDRDLADIRSGLIKSIEQQSRAERVYDAGCEDQVTCGIGNWRVTMEYAQNDVFEQDIFIRQIPNPLAVVWDRMSVDPTGRDAGHVWVMDTMPRRQYEKTWPWAPPPSELGDGILYANTLQGAWFSNDTVRVTEFWQMKTRPRWLAMFNDGSVHDITDMAAEEYADKLYYDSAGKPRVRNSMVPYACMYLVTGWTILEGPYELPISRVPIIRVMGRETRVGDDRVRYGLVRFAKDDQRFMNWMYSTAIEALALAPKAQWIAPAKAVEGREGAFRNAHVSGDPLLIFNDTAPVPPVRVDPPPFPAGMVNMMQLANQGIKDTTGIQNASLGIQSNEVSGKAITARKVEGDQATMIYHDNVNAAIQETGVIVNELIPLCYDSTRIIRVVGVDDKDKLVKINDPNDPDSPDMAKGKYDVVVDTGPSFATQRAETADMMFKLLQTNPALLQMIGDIAFKALDAPGAQEIANRMLKMVPPNLLDPSDLAKLLQDKQQMAQIMSQLDPDAQQQQQEEQQKQQLVEQATAEMGLLQLEEQQGKVRLIEAQADEAEAKADLARVQAGMAPLKEQVDIADKAASAHHTADLAAHDRAKAHVQQLHDTNMMGEELADKRHGRMINERKVVAATRPKPQQPPKGKPRGNKRKN